MKPQYDIRPIDCLGPDGLRTLADKAAEHVITDPPYDAKTHEGMRSIGFDGGHASPIDFAALTGMEHVAEMLRVASRWTIAFCSLEQLGAYAEAAGESWIRSGTWVRTNGTPQLSGDRPAQGAEGVAIMHGPGAKSWNGGGRRAVWTGPREMDGKHPTQKPLWLMEALIRDFTDYGDTILDPFMGSGSTGVAAIRLGRRFIGFERDPKYFAVAQRRISAASEQFDFVEKRPKPQQIKIWETK